MRSNEIYKAKYWIFHNQLTEDVYINTAHKCLSNCRELANDSSTIYIFNHPLILLFESTIETLR